MGQEAPGAAHDGGVGDPGGRLAAIGHHHIVGAETGGQLVGQAEGMDGHPVPLQGRGEGPPPLPLRLLQHLQPARSLRPASPPGPLQELTQELAAVGLDAELDVAVAAYLLALDVHLHYRGRGRDDALAPAAGEEAQPGPQHQHHIGRAGLPLHQPRGEEAEAAVAQGRVLGHGAAGLGVHEHRHRGDLGQLAQQLGPAREPDPPASQDDGALGAGQQVQGRLHRLRPGGGRVLRAQALGPGDLLLLPPGEEDVNGHLQVDGPRPAGGGLADGHGHVFGDALRMVDAARPLGDGAHHLQLGEALQGESVLVAQGAATAQHQHGHAVHEGVGHAGDGIGHPWAGGDGAHPQATGGARPGIGHVGRRLLVAHVHDAEAVAVAGLQDGVNVAAVEGEQLPHAGRLQHAGDHLAAVDAGHGAPPLARSALNDHSAGRPVKDARGPRRAEGRCGPATGPGPALPASRCRFCTGRVRDAVSGGTRVVGRLGEGAVQGEHVPEGIPLVGVAGHEALEVLQHPLGGVVGVLLRLQAGVGEDGRANVGGEAASGAPHRQPEQDGRPREARQPRRRRGEVGAVAEEGHRPPLAVHHPQVQHQRHQLVAAQGAQQSQPRPLRGQEGHPHALPHLHHPPVEPARAQRVHHRGNAVAVQKQQGAGDLDAAHVGAGEDDPPAMGQGLGEVVVAVDGHPVAQVVQVPPLHREQLGDVAAEVAEAVAGQALHLRVVGGAVQQAGVVAAGGLPLLAPEEVEQVGDGGGDQVAQLQGDDGG